MESEVLPAIGVIAGPRTAEEWQERVVRAPEAVAIVSRAEELAEPVVLVVDLRTEEDPAVALRVVELPARVPVVAVAALDADAALRAAGASCVLPEPGWALLHALALSAASRLHSRLVQSLTLARLRIAMAERDPAADGALDGVAEALDTAADDLATVLSDLYAIVGRG